MTMIVPYHDLPFSECLVHYRAIESAINTSIDGRPTTVGIAPGYFVGTMVVHITQPQQFLNFEGFLAEIDGTSNIFSMPLYVGRERPGAAAAGYVQTQSTQAFDDGTTFTDGSSFHDHLTPTNFVADQVAGVASARVVLHGQGSIERGTKFTAFSLHEVTRARDRGNGVWDIQFKPPLSRDHPASRPLEFDRPWMWAQLSDASAGRITNSGRRRHARTTVDVVEATPSSVAQALGVAL